MYINRLILLVLEAGMEIDLTTLKLTGGRGVSFRADGFYFRYTSFSYLCCWLSIEIQTWAF
jgi:hypothetical protein